MESDQVAIIIRVSIYFCLRLELIAGTLQLI